jgi:hypothetical protein
MKCKKCHHLEERHTEKGCVALKAGRGWVTVCSCREFKGE